MGINTPETSEFVPADVEIASKNCDLKRVNRRYHHSRAVQKPPCDKTLMVVGLRLPVSSQGEDFSFHLRGCVNFCFGEAGGRSRQPRSGACQKPSRFTRALSNTALKKPSPAAPAERGCRHAGVLFLLPRPSAPCRGTHRRALHPTCRASARKCPRPGLHAEGCQMSASKRNSLFG